MQASTDIFAAPDTNAVRDANAPFALPGACVWQCGSRRFVLGRPHVMGVLNVTPDSFSDGGLHDAPEQAVAFALQMVEQGADIIDVGGESTRSGAESVTVQQELARVLPVVEDLASRGICVSIDTYHPQVAAECVQAGAQIINDISGFRNPDMVQVAAECDAGLIPMHMAGSPRDMQNDPRYDDVVGELVAYLQQVAQQLQDAGVDRRRICIDPGPGFGKNARHNLQILAGMQAFSQLGYPVIAAFSRKSTLGTICDIPQANQRIVPSTAAAVLAYCGGARIVRVHDVPQTVAALQVAANAAYAQASAALQGDMATLLPGRRALVALGSNMGDPVDNLVQATHRLDELDGVSVIASSSIWRSEPAYYDDQDTFANSAVWVQTTLSPNDLLDRLFEIENEFRRVRVIANGPRTLDLDVLDYQGVTSSDPHLILPHPRIMERDFTVTPILELEQRMRDELGCYVHPSVVDQLGNNMEGDQGIGGFRLADGRRVTSDAIEYGKLIEKLMDADEVI